MSTTEEPPKTLSLLRRWHAGDAQALSALLERHLPSIRERLKKRMGAFLRAKTDPEDLVQGVVLRVLAEGPRFEVANDEHFRMLMARIVENEIRDAHRGFTAMRRDAGREREIPGSTILTLEAARERPDTPSKTMERAEREEWVRLALQVVDEETRRVIVLHEWLGRTFTEIGAALEITEDAARMRYHRAVARLTRTLANLRRGRLERALE